VRDVREIILIRHGQSTANASGVWQGQLDYPLSGEGQRQARYAGLALSGETFDAMYASPLSRAFETAEIIAREAGFTAKIIPIEGMTERHGGVLQGHAWADYEAENPEFARKFLSLPEEERWTMADAETDEEILARFEGSISDITAQHPSGSRIVAVSHGGVMRAFLRDRFGPDVFPDNTRAANASITRLEWDMHGPPRLLELASTDHLPKNQKPGASTVE